MSCSISEDEYLSILEFYQATNGPYWHLKELEVPWHFPCSLSVPCAEHWVGLSCFNTTQFNCTVRSLILKSKNLSGFIPLSISNLSSLSVLDVSSNSITGPIPNTISQMLDLSLIDLSVNFVTGHIPTTIVHASNLVEIYLFSCFLSGGLPPLLGQLSQLSVFDVLSNHITGMIPSNIGQATNLIELLLCSNYLEGSIPSSVGQLAFLSELYLYSNHLSDHISPSIFSINNNLNQFVAFSNLLSGPLPSSIGQLSLLSGLYLYSNRFSQKLPSSIGNLSSLEILLLYGNSFSGSIPLQLGNLSYLTQLYLFSNRLSGPIPSTLGQLWNLGYLDLSHNHLRESIPTELSSLGQLTECLLSANALTGPLSSIFAQMPSLLQLSVAGNFLSGVLPENKEFATSCSRWLELYLYNNMFSGSLPLWMSQCYGLQVLNVNGNMFSGSITTLLSSNLSNIISIDFSSNYFSSSFPNVISSFLSSLTVLNAAENIFSGSFPSSVMLLPLLGNLEVSTNHFSGDLPYLASNYSNWKYLSFSSNEFAGPLPSSLLWMTNLQVLTLSNNQFTELFPLTDFTEVNWSVLQVLDLSLNCFHGEFPSCDVWSRLQALRSLLLDNLGHGSKCQTSSWIHPIHGQFPNCIWSMMPHLSTFHSMGNRLEGQISNISVTSLSHCPSNLIDIAISSNFLTGSIPACFLSGEKTQIQMSNNRFSGVLWDNSSFTVSPDNASDSGVAFALSMMANRLSGPLPQGWRSLPSFEAVSGNLFGCSPWLSQDVDATTTVCGSRDLQQTAIIFGGVVVWIGIISLLLRPLMTSIARPKLNTNHHLQSFWIMLAHWHSRGSTFDSLWKSEILLLDIVANIYIRVLMCCTLVFLMVMNVWMKSTSTKLWSTHTFSYGWSISTSNQHGILPVLILLLLLMLWMIGIRVFLWKTKPSYRTRSFLSTTWNYQDSSIHNPIVQNPVHTPSEAPMERSSEQSCKDLSSSTSSIQSIRRNRQLWGIGLLSIVMLLFGNGIYLQVVLIHSSSQVQWVASVLLGSFKILCSAATSWFLENLHPIQSLQLRNIVKMEWIVGIFNMFWSPVLMMLFTDVNCVYHAIVPIPKLSFQYYTFVQSCISITIPSPFSFEVQCSLLPQWQSTWLWPVWIYSYQCSSSLVQTYSSVLLYAFLIPCLVEPWWKLVSWWWELYYTPYSLWASCEHRHPSSLSEVQEEKESTYLNSTHPYSSKKILIEFFRVGASHLAVVTLSIPPKSKEEYQRNTLQWSKLIIRSLRLSLLLMTFGWAYPPLGFVILCILTWEIESIRIQWGRIHYYLNDIGWNSCGGDDAFVCPFDVTTSATTSTPSNTSNSSNESVKRTSKDCDPFYRDLVSMWQSIWKYPHKDRCINVSRLFDVSVVQHQVMHGWMWCCVGIVLFWSIFFFDMIADVFGVVSGVITVGLWIVGVGIILLLPTLWRNYASLKMPHSWWMQFSSSNAVDDQPSMTCSENTNEIELS